MAKSGAEQFLDLLAGFGVRHFFSNPGSTELPLNDLLVDDQRFSYVLGLHEIAVMSMADGYSMASGSLGVVNLHTCCGLGNAMGMLYNAHCEGSPLLVTAGQQDTRLLSGDPVLAGDMVAVARPWTKYATQVERRRDLPAALQRAVQTALSPPTGPVFLALPMDVQLDEDGPLEAEPLHVPDLRSRPSRVKVDEACELLSWAKRPVILAGSRVTEQQAIEELVKLAEATAAPIFYESATSHGRLPFPCDHPLCRGALPLWSPDVLELLQDHDLIVAVGINLLRLYIYFEPIRPFAPEAKIVHVDCDAREIGKNYATEVGVVGHIGESLSEIELELRDVLNASDKARVEASLAQQKVAAAASSDELRGRIEAESTQFPLSPLALMGRIARWLPQDAAVVEEAVTTTGNVLEKLGAIKRPDGYFAHRGWALGWGIGCAVGVKLAWPDRPVISLIGDGAATYGIQSLWSAAKYGIQVTIVICNNRQYRILKDCANVLELPRAVEGRYLGMDLSGPHLDFVGLAEALGVRATRPQSVAELDAALEHSLEYAGPTLIDVALSE